MPITVSHSPVGSLVSAAKAAGEATYRRGAKARDMGFLKQQQALQYQLTQASMARNMRQQELDLRAKAMELQTAAANRISRTPTGRREGVSPLAVDTAQRLGALQEARARGTITDPQFEAAQLAVNMGSSTLLNRALASPEKPKELTYYQKRQELQDRANMAGAVKRMMARFNDPKTPGPEKARLERQQYQIQEQGFARWGEGWDDPRRLPRDYEKMGRPPKPPAGVIDAPRLPANINNAVKGKAYTTWENPPQVVVYKGKDSDGNPRLQKMAFPEEE